MDRRQFILSSLVTTFAAALGDKAIVFPFKAEPIVARGGLVPEIGDRYISEPHAARTINFDLSDGPDRSVLQELKFDVIEKMIDGKKIMIPTLQREGAKAYWIGGEDGK